MYLIKYVSNKLSVLEFILNVEMLNVVSIKNKYEYF